MTFDKIVDLQKEFFKSVGEGFDISFDYHDITGFALKHENKIVHFFY